MVLNLKWREKNHITFVACSFAGVWNIDRKRKISDENDPSTLETSLKTRNTCRRVARGLSLGTMRLDQKSRKHVTAISAGRCASFYHTSLGESERRTEESIDLFR